MVDEGGRGGEATSEAGGPTGSGAVNAVADMEDSIMRGPGQRKADSAEELARKFRWAPLL